MEENIINETSYTISSLKKEMINKIASLTEKKLSLENTYVTSLILVDSKAIHDINLQYRGIDKPTDVISFALLDSDNLFENDEAERELGDIFINVDAIHEQSKMYEHSEERELGFLFGHGLLHLLGYDHIEETDEKEMFALQEEIIDEIIPRYSKQI